MIPTIYCGGIIFTRKSYLQYFKPLDLILMQAMEFFSNKIHTTIMLSCKILYINDIV